MAKSKRRVVGKYTNVGLRILEGRTQMQVAKLLGISQQTVSKKLRGETAILLSDIGKLSKKMKVPVTYFFKGYEGSPSAFPKKTK